MAHLKQGKEDRQRLIRPIIDFTAHLRERITTSGEAAPSTLISELKSHISTLRTCGGSLLDVDHGTTAQELDSQATRIWNLAARLNREHEYEYEYSDQLKALLRVFAFHLLDSVDRSAAKQGSKQKRQARWKQTVRLLRTGLKTARHCLSADMLEHAAKILERGADLMNVSETLVPKAKAWIETVGEDQDGNEQEDEEEDEETRMWRNMQSEYLQLRVTLAWKQDNLELAEMMYKKAYRLGLNANRRDLLEELADPGFEIGRELYKKQQFSQASTWLDLANDCLCAAGPEPAPPDVEELRLSILHLWVRSRMGRNIIDDLREHDSAISWIQRNFPDRMIRYILQLDLIILRESCPGVIPYFDADFYFKILSRMLRTVHMTSKNFDVIVSYIRKLKDRDYGQACQALDDLLFLRLLDHDNEDWIDKVFITRLWMSAENTTDASTTTTDALHEVMSTMHTKLQRPLPGKAVYAAQTLLWKRVDACSANEDWTSADVWSRLSLHPLLANAGDANTAKIARRAISCAIAREDLASARSTFNQMTEAARKEPLTQYLAYKIALREHDDAFATECFEIIAARAEKDPTLLYACVLEAQQSGSRAEAIKVLGAVLAKQHSYQLKGGHLPTLFRCTLKLMVADLPAVDTSDSSTISESICYMFEQAWKARDALECTEQPFNFEEVEWFKTNSYNLALKHYTNWPTGHVLRLIDVCSSFCECQHQLSEPANHTDISRLEMVLDSLAAQCCLKLARQEADDRQKRAWYLKLMGRVRDYNEALEDDIQGGGRRTEEFQPITRRLVVSEIEAVMQVGRWDSLSEVVERVRSLDDTKVYNILADMLLPSLAPASEKFNTLQQIVRASQSAGFAFTPATQARWYRIMYQLAIQSTSTSDSGEGNLADDVVQEILDFIQRGTMPTQYPAEELEYLATSTYNRAIDAYVAGDERRCKALGKWASDFARWADAVTEAPGRGGKLSALIESKLKELLVGDVEEQ